jgi:diaminopropionate ammonia-lyase
MEIADVGVAGPASWVIDGYATLFSELAAQSKSPQAILVPVGVGSLAAAAARYAAAAGVHVIGVEPVTAACLSASLGAGEPTAVPTPGTSMAGLDCAEVSLAAWPSLRAGIHATVTVDDDEVRGAMRELASHGLTIGESGAAPLAALEALLAEAACGPARDALALGPRSRVVLIATEGPTGSESQP